MGYPMTYNRVLCRNSLGGNYTKVRQYIQPDGTWINTEKNADGSHVVHYANTEMMPGYTEATLNYDPRLMIAGDLRRLEKDSVEPGYRRTQIAKDAGVDEETVVKVLKAFFEDHETSYCKLPNVPPHDDLWEYTYREGGYYPPEKK